MKNGADFDISRALEWFDVVRDIDATLDSKQYATALLKRYSEQLLPLALAEIKRLRGSLSIGNNAWVDVGAQTPKIPGDYAVLIDGSLPMICAWYGAWAESGVTHWSHLPVWPQQLRLT